MLIESFAYSAECLDELLRFSSQNAARRSAEVYMMPSDIVWGGPSSEWIQLWRDNKGIAGFAWFDPLTDVEFDLRWDLDWEGEGANAMIEWAERRRRELPEAYPRFIDLESMPEWQEEILNPRKSQPDDGLCLTATAFETDARRISAMERRGYRPTRHYCPDYRYDLTLDIPGPQLPEGMEVRSVRPADLKKRVDTHRDAWLKSTWSLERYSALRSGPLYDPDLDLVVEIPSGDFANCCICWADPGSGIGSFEPVGTRPAWRGKGLTRELIREGFRRLKKKGMYVARVGTAGFNHPAQALYEGSGFQRTGTKRTFMKRIAP